MNSCPLGRRRELMSQKELDRMATRLNRKQKRLMVLALMWDQLMEEQDVEDRHRLLEYIITGDEKGLRYELEDNDIDVEGQWEAFEAQLELS